VLVACSSNGDNGASPTQPPADKPNVQATLPAGAPTQPGGAAVSDEPVAFQTADGVTFRGHLYAPAGARRKVAVLASTVPQSIWKAHAAAFAGQGLALLTFDPRGVGETGGTRSEAQLAADITLAVGFIKSRDYAQVYLIGIGAPMSTAAFTVAATQDLAGVGGLPAGGVTSQEIARVAEPKLFMAEENDRESVQNIDRLMAAAPGFKQKFVFQAGSGPSTDVLAIATVKQAILDFVNR
jgi:hypothetical protein